MTTLRRCARCGGDSLVAAVVSEVMEVDGRTFEAELPATRCESCGEIYFDLGTIGTFEMLVAAKLVELGARSGAALRFMRKAMGMRAVDLAELLDVAPETLSRWENEQREVDLGTLMTVGSLVLDAARGASATLDRLKALRSPPPASDRVIIRVGSGEEAA